MTKRTSFHCSSPSPSWKQRIRAIWTDPDMYELGEVADSYLPRRAAGRHRDFPSAVHLMDHAGRSACGGFPGYFKTIAEPAFYRELRRSARDLGGLSLPDDPPDDGRARTWRETIAPRRRRAGAADLATVSEPLAALLAQLPRLGVRRAQRLGSLLPEQPFDPVQPNPGQLLVVDGTMIAPFSGVRLVTLDGTQHAVGSRACCPEHARVQAVVHHKSNDDGRRYSGINHVAVLAQTTCGWVVLGVARALSAETAAALDLIAPVVDHGRRGVRGVLYDKLINGWPTRKLIRHHGLFVYRKVKARNAVAEEVQAARLNARALLAARGITAGLTSRLVEEIAGAQLDRAHNPDALLPLGKCRYQDAHGRTVYVDSDPIPLEVVPHRDDGCGRDHALYVDDDGLADAETIDGQQYKVNRATCVHAEMRQDAGGFYQSARWRLDCPAGEIFLNLDWIPTQLEPDGPATARTTRDRALEQLAIISRADPNALMVHGNRETIESYFARFDESQPRNRHAAFLDADHQLLDFFAFGLLKSAEALRASRFGLDIQEQ